METFHLVTVSGDEEEFALPTGVFAIGAPFALPFCDILLDDEDHLWRQRDLHRPSPARHDDDPFAAGPPIRKF